MRKQKRALTSTTHRAYFHCVYLLKCHLILFTKNRKPLFSDPNFTLAMRAEIQKIAERWFVTIVDFDVQPDHLHLTLNLTPSIQPSRFVNSLKTVSSMQLKKHYGDYLKQYLDGSALWARAYCLVSDSEHTQEIITNYIADTKRPT